MATSSEPRFKIKNGNLEPPLDIELTDQDGFAIVLAGTETLVFRWERVGKPASEVTGIGVSSIVTNGVASTGPKDKGTPAKVRYNFAATETDISDDYNLEVDVIAAGRPRTFPSDETFYPFTIFDNLLTNN